MVHWEFNTGSIFTQLAKKYHPDTNPDDPDSKEKFAKLAEAYEVRDINIHFSFKCLELHFYCVIWFYFNPFFLFFFCIKTNKAYFSTIILFLYDRICMTIIKHIPLE